MRALRRAHRAQPELLRRPSAGSRQRVPRSDPRGPVAAGSPSTSTSGGSADPSRAPRLLVIVGPTGTGKSEIAVRCARRIGGEIVGCDAVQVYRGLDAATAKPTSEQRRAVPHHLVDVADPEDEFTLADWVRLAETAISEISGRGRVPVIVGGTGMYLRGLLRGLVAAPPVDRRTRERLRAMASRFGAPRMHRWLCRLDPASAARLAPGDTQRILRAIELARSGEGTWSERLARDGTWASGVERYPALKYAVDMDRDRLAERLAARVDAFFAAGLVAEIRTMLDRGVPRTANALKAIGYREVLEALDRGRDPLDAREDIVRNTRRYSRRQRTWFRGEPGIEWLDAGLGADAVSDAIARGWAE